MTQVGYILSLLKPVPKVLHFAVSAYFSLNCNMLLIFLTTGLDYFGSRTALSFFRELCEMKTRESSAEIKVPTLGDSPKLFFVIVT